MRDIGAGETREHRGRPALDHATLSLVEKW